MQISGINNKNSIQNVNFKAVRTSKQNEYLLKKIDAFESVNSLIRRLNQEKPETISLEQRTVLLNEAKGLSDRDNVFFNPEEAQTAFSNLKELPGKCFKYLLDKVKHATRYSYQDLADAYTSMKTAQNELLGG